MNGTVLGRISQGQYNRDVIQQITDNLRIFSPDETTSNRWNTLFELTNRFGKNH